MARALESAGHLTRSPGGRYRLIEKVRGDSLDFLADLLRAASPVMRDLERRADATIHLAALIGNRIEVIAVNSRGTATSRAVGRFVPPHASSLGKAIAAFQPGVRAGKLIRGFGLVRFTPQSIILAEQLGCELGGVRVRGFALDREEWLDGYSSCASPIFDAFGAVRAAIGVTAPVAQMSRFRASLIAGVRRAAGVISAAMRFGDGRDSREHRREVG